MNYSVEEMPPPMSKGQAWSEWWFKTRGQFMSVGTAHPMEHALYDAFMAGWTMRDNQWRERPAKD
jgi:hypothetical protein